MLGKLLEFLAAYLQEKPLWARLRPYAAILAAAVAALVLAHQYVQWRYGLSMDVWLFLGSYLARRVLILFGGLGAAVLMIQYSPRLPEWVRVPKVGQFFRTHGRALLARAAILTIVVGLVAIGLRATAPHQVTHIRVQFLDRPPAVEKDALAYLIYELNRRQPSWHFELEFRDFNSASLPSATQRLYRGRELAVLDLAALAADGRPYVALTGESLQPSLFWVHDGPVSVISTADRAAYLPLSDYEFVMHCLIVQGMVIHLDQHGGLPPRFFERRDASRGSVFDFSPDPRALKSVILAAELRPDEEALLLNRFGPEYLQGCRALLSLDWMRSDRVAGTLDKVFGVRLATARLAGEPKMDAP